MDNLDDIFCDVDDFCRVFIPQWKKHQLADGSSERFMPSCSANFRTDKPL
jgi:hypothetical protein